MKAVLGSINKHVGMCECLTVSLSASSGWTLLCHYTPTTVRGGEWSSKNWESRQILPKSRNLAELSNGSRILRFCVCRSHICFPIKSLHFFISGSDFKMPVSASRRVSDFTIRHPNCTNLVGSLSVPVTSRTTASGSTLATGHEAWRHSIHQAVSSFERSRLATEPSSKIQENKETEREARDRD